MNYDHFDNRQGRDGLHSVNASRAALGMAPLHRDDAQDEPETLPAWLAFMFVCAAAFCAAIACGWLDSLFQRITQ